MPLNSYRVCYRWSACNPGKPVTVFSQTVEFVGHSLGRRSVTHEIRTWFQWISPWFSNTVMLSLSFLPQIHFLIQTTAQMSREALILESSKEKINTHTAELIYKTRLHLSWQISLLSPAYSLRVLTLLSSSGRNKLLLFIKHLE